MVFCPFPVVLFPQWLVVLFLHWTELGHLCRRLFVSVVITLPIHLLVP